MKALKAIGIGLLALMAIAGIMHAGGAGIESKVVRDCIKEYNATKAKGDAVSICAHAGLVKEACIQAHDEKCAKEWAAIEKTDCAGM